MTAQRVTAAHAAGLSEPALTLVVDDMPASLQWLAAAASEAFPGTEVLRAATLAQARALVAARTPQLALVDLDLPDGRGTALIEELARRTPRPVIVVATVFADDRHLFPALRAGAAGYVLKDDSIDTLAALLRGLARGEPPLSGPIARRLVGWFNAEAADAADAGAKLSGREEQMLQLLGKGLTIAEAGAALGITAATAASYAKTLYRKLDVTSRAEATIEATRRGLL